MKTKKLIFDLGANRGQNLKYYLSHADKVVAVEANPDLVKDINLLFANDIATGRLVVINKCISEENLPNSIVDFYVNRFDSGLSRFTPPKYHPEDFNVIQIESVTYSQLLSDFGQPEFVKIDLEGYDKILLNNLIDNDLLPAYLSTENCGLQILNKLIASGKYNCFNIVSFYNYEDHYIKTTNKTAGPFGDDIKSPWLSKQDILELYSKMPGSWFDLHATKDIYPTRPLEFKYYRKRFNLSLFIKK